MVEKENPYIRFIYEKNNFPIIFVGMCVNRCKTETTQDRVTQHTATEKDLFIIFFSMREN